VPTADKRQRKKENARMAREAREAQVKKRKRNRTIRNAAIAVGVFVIAVVLISVLTKDDKNSNASSSTTAASNTTSSSPPKNQNQSAPAMTIDPNKTYTADISTTYGDMKVALDAKNAPKGVNNFVHLARQGFYDGLTWHRLVKGFVIQGGDPKGDGSGGPGYDIVTELPKNGYPLGTLAYAKTGDAPAGSAGSQFFVVTVDRPASLEQKLSGSYQYGVFGHVTSGMPVAMKIESYAPAGANGGAPEPPIYIKKVTITEK
jgi:cyclophilin family peptidyl-prolyl cis-trans isomerase